MQNTAKQN